MNKNPFSVRPQNWDSFQSLVRLLTTDQRPALNPTHLRILEYVGSFLPEKGCWEDTARINEQSVKLTPKTFRLHVEYLVDIGALVLQKNDEGRVVYRIGVPAGPVCSQRTFRVNKGLADYRYARSPSMNPDTEQLPDFFADDAVESTVPNRKILPSAAVESTVEGGRIYRPEGKILPPFPSTTTETNHRTELKKGTTDLLPPIPPRSFSDSTAGDEGLPGQPDGCPGGPAGGRPSEEGCRLPEGQERISNEKNDDQGDKFFPGKHEKKHKTLRERRAEAVQKIDAGHIANPLGAPDNRKRQHNAKMARAIEATGAVTNAQLWGHLVRLWDAAFGEGILENMMSKDKSAVAALFSELQGKFATITGGFYPENRDLAEYFTWFLDPKRLSGILSSAKYASGKDCIHVRQIAGQVYIKRFYDEVIARRKDHTVSVAVRSKSQADKMAVRLEEIFQDFRENFSNHYEFTIKMAAHGYALAAQYLHDECGMDEPACREHMIQAMLTFYRGIKDKAKAEKFLRAGVESTGANETLLLPDSCIWYNWREKTTGLVETVVERAKSVV